MHRLSLLFSSNIISLHHLISSLMIRLGKKIIPKHSSSSTLYWYWKRLSFLCCCIFKVQNQYDIFIFNIELTWNRHLLKRRQPTAIIMYLARTGKIINVIVLNYRHILKCNLKSRDIPTLSNKYTDMYIGVPGRLLCPGAGGRLALCPHQHGRRRCQVPSQPGVSPPLGRSMAQGDSTSPIKPSGHSAFYLQRFSALI